MDIVKEAKDVFNKEIKELISLKETIGDDFLKAVDCIYKCTGKVIFTGVGKSAHISSKIASTMSSLGTPSFFIHSSELAHGDLGAIEKNDIVVILSNSGETKEIINIMDSIKKRDSTIILIAQNKDCTLAKCADLCLETNVSTEACHLNLAPTNSATAMLVLGDALAITLSNLKKYGEKDFYCNHPGGKLGEVLNKDYNIETSYA
ncbi:MAG: SIS domain-containing protein [Bacillota bacterium]|nr:SIS domain-containing protein [Bacillota bacterium]